MPTTTLLATLSLLINIIFFSGEAKCGLNVHNLAHICTNVRSWGPLWCYSCFRFEDLNGDCVKAVHGSRDICNQVIKINICIFNCQPGSINS